MLSIRRIPFWNYILLKSSNLRASKMVQIDTIGWINIKQVAKTKQFEIFYRTVLLIRLNSKTKKKMNNNEGK